jgi:hypothetical protein
MIDRELCYMHTQGTSCLDLGKKDNLGICSNEFIMDLLSCSKRRRRLFVHYHRIQSGPNQIPATIMHVLAIAVGRDVDQS